MRRVELLKKGVMWRVGSGENIDAFRDPWIRRGVTCRPSTPSEAEEPIMVSDLIDSQETRWDSDLIQTVFGPDDAKEILAIPVRSDMEDWVAWHYDAKGVFSVKSAYLLGISLRDLKECRDAGSSAEQMTVNPL